MSKILELTAANGVPFRVVYYSPGETGPYPHAASATKELVEFYDGRYQHTKHGQFVSRYYLSTLLGRDPYSSRVTGGLSLCGGEASWQLDAASMQLVVAWLEHLSPPVVECALEAGHIAPCIPGVAQVPAARLCQLAMVTA